ncbi:MAG: DNA polymerase III subunit delta [Planctomycetaceae bacterium]|nr:DNA polymerase III subunit delta [Planctomycetaceae bacterium]
MAKSKGLHATEFLGQAKPDESKSVYVLFGDDAFLKSQVLKRLRKLILADDDAEFSLTRYEGNQATFATVLKELSMMTMFGGGQFGGGRRLVIIDDADPFVTRFRDELEDYVAKPSKTATLIFVVGTFPSNTRLYKSVDASETALAIDCGALAESAIPKWLAGWAGSEHKIACETAAAELLVDLVGTELGLLDQELAKLALMVSPNEKSPNGKLTAAVVQEQVGSWRTRTTWEMLDLALAGNVPEAIRQLDMLLQAGENPVGVLAQIAYTLRRFAAATQLILDAEKQGKRLALPVALEQAGVKKFVIQKSEEQLKKLGRHRGAKMLGWLLKADLDFKGDSRIDPRLTLEQMIVRVAAPQLRQQQ